MESYDSGSKTGWLILGIGVGIGLGMLLAPRTGEEMRQSLRESTERGREALSQGGQRLGESARNLMDKSKDFVQRQREQVRDAVNTGKQAYQEEKQTRNGGSHDGELNR